MARSTYKMSPLAYMEEGQKRRDAGEFVKPTDAEELYLAFIEYCKFMQDNYFSQAHKNKNGEDCSVYISRPMTIESFRLFAGINPVEYGELTGDPVAAAIGGTIEDAINSQQIEGALVGKYAASLIQVLQGRKTNVNLTGGITLEQITGMEVK